MQVENLVVTLSLTGNTAERGQKIGGARGPGNLLSPRNDRETLLMITQ